MSGQVRRCGALATPLAAFVLASCGTPDSAVEGARTNAAQAPPKAEATAVESRVDSTLHGPTPGTETTPPAEPTPSGGDRFDTVFRLVRKLTLEETREVVNVAPLFFADPEGGLLVADTKEQQYRRYASDGKLEWSFGSEGFGGASVTSANTIARLSPDLLFFGQRTPRGGIWNERTRRVERFYDVVVTNIGNPAIALSPSTVLIHAPVKHPGERALHILNAQSGAVVRSFFTPHITDITKDAIRGGLGRTRSIVHGDTIFSVFAYADTLYLHASSGSFLGKVRIPISNFVAPYLRAQEFDSGPEWMAHASEAWALRWAPDFLVLDHVLPAGTEVDLPRGAMRGPEKMRALIGFTPRGEQVFEIFDPPGVLVAIDVEGNFYFDDPAFEAPRHLIVARYAR
jgi:hypothetical protein